MVTNIGLELYKKYKEDKELNICETLQICAVTPPGTPVSLYRKVTKPVSPKISVAALIFDYFIDKRIFILESLSVLYVEIDKTPYVIDLKGASISAIDSYENRHFVLLEVIRDLYLRDNIEFAKTFRSIIDDWKKRGCAEWSDIALFCDSFYVWHKQNGYSITDVKDTLIEVQRGFDTGLFKIPDDTGMFKDLTMANPTCINMKETRKKKNKSTPSKETDFFKDCKNGKYFIDHAWDSNSALFIPGIERLENFVEIPHYKPLVNKLAFRLNKAIQDPSHCNYVNFTLVGKPGTGKTNLIYALGATLKMPVYTVSCSQNTDEDTFQGMTKIIDGKPQAVDTDTVHCFEHGGILILEEVNLSQPAVIMGALGQAVEYPYILKKDGYKTIHRHPLCVIVSTMNIGTAGSKTVSQPFANRFKQSFILNDPDREMFVNILMKYDDIEETQAKKRCEWIYDTYLAIVNTIKTENATADVDSILLTLSLRSCIGALENMQEGMEPIDAVKDSIIGKIAETDMEVADNCMMVLLSRPELKS